MHKSTMLCAAAVIAAASCTDSPVTTAASSTTGGTATTSTGVTITADSTLKTDGVVVGSSVPVRVRVAQNGAGLANVVVGWTVGTGGGAVSAASSVTDSTGVASVTWAVPDTVRTNTLTAAITGASVVISATTIGGPISTMLKVSADSDAVVSGATLPITVRAVDRFGNGTSGVTVNWTATGGSVSAASTVSGSNGNATMNFTTGATPATYFVTASVPGQVSVTFKIVGL